MDLMAAIREFKLQHQHEWSTQKGALYMCDTASPLFVRFLREAGLDQLVGARTYDFNISPNCWSSCANPDPKMYTSGSNESGNTRAVWHMIVETNDFYIDWTARQYIETAPFPHIIPRKVQLKLFPEENPCQEIALAAHA